MNKQYKLVILLVIVGMASAAVYVAVNPEAWLSFTRPEPTPDPSDPAVLTLIECGAGFASACGMGEMTTNVLDRDIMHENTAEIPYNGVVYFNISCSEGLYLAPNGGIYDFNAITFIDPYGNSFACNNGGCIEQIDTNTIRITPTTDVFSFAHDVITFTNLNISFRDNAYGDYVLAAYVGSVPST